MIAVKQAPYGSWRAPVTADAMGADFFRTHQEKAPPTGAGGAIIEATDQAPA